MRVVAQKPMDLRNPGFALAVLGFFLLFGFSVAQAKDQLNQGLKVGTKIPNTLTVADQSGEAYSLRSLSGRSGLILLFTRSLDW